MPSVKDVQDEKIKNFGGSAAGQYSARRFAWTDG